MFATIVLELPNHSSTTAKLLAHPVSNVVENGIEVEYNTSQLLSSEPSTVLSSLTGKSTSSKSELTIPEAVSSIDDELVKFKNNLESFSYIYDNSQNKVVTLHSYIQSMNTKLNNLTKQLEDVAEKTKNL